MEGRVGGASSHAFRVYIPATLAPRNPINSWQAAPWRREAGRYRVLMKMLRLATRRRAVLGATFLDSNDSFGYLSPQAGLSGDVRVSACICTCAKRAYSNDYFAHVA